LNLAFKHTFLFCFLFCIVATHAQQDTSTVRGKIKIGKPKSDTVYIKAVMNFTEFKNVSKKDQVSFSAKDVVEPKPKHCFQCVAPLDYNTHIQNKVHIPVSDLGDKTTDTVRIQVKVLKNGKPYYKDITPLLVLNGVPAYYDASKNAYKLDAIHFKCLDALKDILDWEPAYCIEEEKDTFKGIVVIKPKKTKVVATGVLTVVLSKLPFEE
jgi:hypothetical protein